MARCGVELSGSGARRQRRRAISEPFKREAGQQQGETISRASHSRRILIASP